MNIKALFRRIEVFYRRVTPQEFARLQGDSKAAEAFFGVNTSLEVEDLLAELEKLPAELPEQGAQPFEASGLRLGLPFEAAEDRRDQSLGASDRLPLADAQLLCHRLQAAHLGQGVSELHGVLH